MTTGNLPTGRREVRNWSQRAGLITIAMAIVIVGCSAPSERFSNGADRDDSINTPATAAFDPAAKGPAPEVPGAKPGGTVTVVTSQAPHTFDPARAYYQDVNAILRLTTRALTAIVVRDGASVLVPDLATDLGKVSADELTWTFTLKDGLKYEDGSSVEPADIAYAIKRSFAHEELPSGPTYQDTYFKDGGTYNGPYKSGNGFAGVSTPDNKTVAIHLARPFADLPYFASFQLFGPLPEEKDTKENYSNHPLSTGPYMFDSYQPGQRLVLKKNPNWDPDTDPARHQYPDTFDFKFSQDLLKAQTQILAGNGVDATSLNYDGVDSSLIPQVTSDHKANLVSGPSPCTSFQTLDTRKIPLPVRTALALAWNFEDENKAAGLNPLNLSPATTVAPPQTPGWFNFDALGTGGRGTGDPVKARQMLQTAGKIGFTIRWYYANNSEIAPKVAQVRTSWLTEAGFDPEPIGVPRQQLRDVVAKSESPANIGQGPAGWCTDWPSGATLFPAIFDSSAAESGNSAGFLNDPFVDSEINRITALPAAQAGGEWAKFERHIMTQLLPVIPLGHAKSSLVVGRGLGNVVNDPNFGMPDFPVIFVK